MNKFELENFESKLFKLYKSNNQKKCIKISFLPFSFQWVGGKDFFFNF